MRLRRLPLVLLVLAAVPFATVRAAALETLLMPGKVIAGHAQIEAECGKCHDRADRERQPALCLDCHDKVAADLRERRGFHGRQSNADQVQCSACHTEHRGRDADIVQLARPAFDHARTDFALEGAHLGAACDACHKTGQAYRAAPSRCLDCHRDDEPHGGQLGTDCGACHGPDGWARGRFDHARTDFALRDRHAEAACAACHLGNRYRATPTQCASCHAPDDVHRGNRGPDCAACHTAVGWKTSRFDHGRETGYALGGVHAQADCKSCHTSASIKDPLPRDCAGCHRSDDAHATRFGDGCERCHGQVAWQPANYDHARDAKFALAGRHAELDCHACHTAVVAQQKLGTDCHSCHRTSDVHAGRLGPDCGGCHGTEGWRRDVAFDHDLTEFPLVGLHPVVPCHECHASATYRGVAQDCNACHQRTDKHRGALGRDCEACHSPNGWRLWTFDHGQASGFALEGAHQRASCESCHRQPPEAVKLASDCASCHARQDVHFGQFGRQCQRCHTAASFAGARAQ